jgi:small subunit ribosomal protein S21
MAEIIIEANDSVERAIKLFRRKVQRDGILKDLRARRHFVKPSERRRKKAEAARRLRLKKARRDER